MNVCENTGILTIISVCLTIIDIIKIIIPIILIVTGTINFSKAVIINDEKIQKESGKIFIRKLRYAALIFTVPWLVKVTLISAGNILQNIEELDNEKLNFTDCLENANSDKIAELKEEQKETKELKCWRCNSNSELYEWSIEATNSSCDDGWFEVSSIETEENCKVEYQDELDNKETETLIKNEIENTDDDNVDDEIYIDNNKKEEENDDKNTEEDKKDDEKENDEENKKPTGTIIGQKYNDLTDAQLRAIARLCQQEQGTAVGAAAEASLMANHFELDLYKGGTTKYGPGGNGLYNYVAYSGWFANSKNYMGIVVDKTGEKIQTEEEAEKMLSELRTDVYTAVYEVLILGKRTLPFYIDEHDCIKCWGGRFDIEKIIFNGTIITDEDGLLNRDNYIEHSTKIYNRYGSEYTFYTFPTKTSDPFGYTSDAKKKYDSLTK